MYYRHSLNYRYPERSDEHMIDVKHLRDVNLDTKYPYLQKSFFFQCQRALLHVCRYSVLPITFSFRPRTGLWKLLGKSPPVDLNIGDPIFRDKGLPVMEAVKKLQRDAYHIMQGMNGIHPGDPTYRTEQDIETYQKTM